MKTLPGIGMAMMLFAAAAAAGPLQPGDMVTVNVHRHPELSTTTQVDGNGYVSLAYVGNVSVAGLDEAAATDRVANALTVILRNPRVTVHRQDGFAPYAGHAPRTEDMRTKVVQLHNARAASLRDALDGMSTAGGSISHDEATNTLILTDSPNTLQNMLSVVHELDQMRTQITQVHIETMIAEVESGAMREIGVRWFTQGDRVAGGYVPGQRQSQRLTSLRGSNDPLFNERLEAAGGDFRSLSRMGRRFIDEPNFDRRMQVPVQVAAPGQMFLGYLNSGIDLGMMLDLLVADNKAELLATPYIRTVNHQKAVIKMTEEVPYTEVATAGLSTLAQVRFLDIGIVLEVTPHVRRDPNGQHYVQLELEPEVSTAMGVASGVPVRSVRSSRNVANVRNAQTLVIGGIVQSDSRDVVQRVPGLGSLPLFGRLFKHTEKSVASRELMIFVTPTIHENPETITWDRTLNMTDVHEGPAPPTLRAASETRKE